MLSRTSNRVRKRLCLYLNADSVDKLFIYSEYNLNVGTNIMQTFNKRRQHVLLD